LIEKEDPTFQGKYHSAKKRKPVLDKRFVSSPDMKPPQDGKAVMQA
jgi:hypothetical protein